MAAVAPGAPGRSTLVDRIGRAQAPAPILVALGLEAADPLIGMVVTAVILRITWHSFLTVRNEQPGEPVDGGHTR